MSQSYDIEAEKMRALVKLLREGREMAMVNTRVAAVRHRLWDWGERVERYLEVDFPE